MPTDQKISELPVASAIGNSDACLLISNGADYQFAMSLLLQYVGTNLNTGAVISFGNALPQNTTGKNGDVFINATTGAMAQKLSGTWAVTYSPPSVPTAPGSTILYGLGQPASSAGNEGDTYVNTASGVFYKKSGSSWNQVFSMQSGPAGPQGLKGDTGLTGANGNTLLNGGGNPSNQNTGNNGDFYLNTSSFTLFGPKTSDNWGTGVSLSQAPPAPAVIDLPVGTAVPIVVGNYQTSYQDYTSFPTLLIHEVTDTNTVKERTDIQPSMIFVNNLLDSISIDIPGDANGKSTLHLQLIIKP